jgi:predicted GNAT family N-acyltransferase
MTNTIWKKPSECAESELTMFESLINMGGEVVTHGLHDRIMRAEWLVFLFESDKTLAGVAALKKPNANYKKNVFKKANSPEDPSKFDSEAGWIFVEQQYRGRKHSRTLLQTVLKLADNRHVYATTREDNEAMRRTNLHCGLKESGQPYKSEEGDYKLVLYVKDSSQ